MLYVSMDFTESSSVTDARTTKSVEKSPGLPKSWWTVWVAFGDRLIQRTKITSVPLRGSFRFRSGSNGPTASDWFPAISCSVTVSSKELPKSTGPRWS